MASRKITYTTIYHPTVPKWTIAYLDQAAHVQGFEGDFAHPEMAHTAFQKAFGGPEKVEFLSGGIFEQRVNEVFKERERVASWQRGEGIKDAI